jgi:hypothetical protein
VTRVLVSTKCSMFEKFLNIQHGWTNADLERKSGFPIDQSWVRNRVHSTEKVNEMVHPLISLFIIPRCTQYRGAKNFIEQGKSSRSRRWCW